MPTTPKRLVSDFSATFVETDGKVLASYVVRFATEDRIRDQTGSMLHDDMAAARTWIDDQARRRGLHAIQA